MFIRSGAVLALMLALGAGGPQAGVRQAVPAATLHVSHRSGPLSPGDVLWIAVSPSVPVTAVSGAAFGSRIRFWPSDTAGEWQALVAVGLETSPGFYELTIQAVGTAGATLTQTVPLQIRGKTFETRQLRVSNQFVEPPPAEAERIARDARAVAAVYARTDTEPLWRGPFVMPVPGRSTSSFGRLSVYNGQPRGRHQGADFAAATGTPVRAPNAGRVVLAEDLFLSGNTVILDHGAGLFSVFAHLSRIAVAVGTHVAGGELLGDAGATGRVTGPHLHWAIRIGDVSVDPLSLIAAAAELSEPVVRSAVR